MYTTHTISIEIKAGIQAFLYSAIKCVEVFK